MNVVPIDNRRVAIAATALFLLLVSCGTEADETTAEGSTTSISVTSNEPTSANPSPEATDNSDSADNSEAAEPPEVAEGDTGSTPPSSEPTAEPDEEASGATIEGSFVAPTADGGQINLNDLAGKDIVLWYWAPW